MALMAKYGINCRRKIEPCWTETIIPTTETGTQRQMPHCGRSFTTSRGRTLSRKTVVNSVTDTNPENFAVKERIGG